MLKFPARFLLSSYTHRYCKKGHTGMLCAVCEDGWYRRGSASTCIICDDDDAAVAWAVGLSVGVVVAVIAVVLMDLRFGWSRAKGGSRLKLLVNWYVYRI